MRSFGYTCHRIADRKPFARNSAQTIPVSPLVPVAAPRRRRRRSISIGNSLRPPGTPTLQAPIPEAEKAPLSYALGNFFDGRHIYRWFIRFCLNYTTNIVNSWSERCCKSRCTCCIGLDLCIWILVVSLSIGLVVPISDSQENCDFVMPMQNLGLKTITSWLFFRSYITQLPFSP